MSGSCSSKSEADWKIYLSDGCLGDTFNEVPELPNTAIKDIAAPVHSVSHFERRSLTSLVLY